MLTTIFAIITTTRRPVEAGADSSGILVEQADPALYYGFVPVVTRVDASGWPSDHRKRGAWSRQAGVCQ
jgi:hypothetical protein